MHLELNRSRTSLDRQCVLLSGADSGFLERELICINVCVGVALLILSHFFKIPNENEIIWSQ